MTTVAHYYGALQGQSGMATRLGSKRSGIMATVETWGSELRSDLNFSRFHDTDVLSVRFGRKNNSSTPVLTITNPDAVADVISDERIAKLFEQMNELSKKITAEVPKAQRRRELAAKRAERERRAKDKQQAELRAGMSEAERENMAAMIHDWEIGRCELRRGEDGHLYTEATPAGAHYNYTVDLTTAEWVIDFEPDEGVKRIFEDKNYRIEKEMVT